MQVKRHICWQVLLALIWFIPSGCACMYPMLYYIACLYLGGRHICQICPLFDKILAYLGPCSLYSLHSSAAGRQRAIYQNVNHFPAFALCATFKAIRYWVPSLRIFSHLEHERKKWVQSDIQILLRFLGT